MTWRRSPIDGQPLKGRLQETWRLRNDAAVAVQRANGLRSARDAGFSKAP
jgi:hypothetical protein